ncbi:MAG: hypothetical protein ACMXX9_04875 [Candidatus Woesearchaeota archaeon]
MFLKKTFPTYRVLNYNGIILDDNKNNSGFIISDNNYFLGKTDSIDNLLNKYDFLTVNYDDYFLKSVYHKSITHQENKNFLEASKYVGNILGYFEKDVLKEF